MASSLLIDGNNIVFRAYYAFQNQNFKTSSGQPTGALYGFVKMLLKLLKERKPDFVAVAFDKSKYTFRKKMYESYKANRKATPPDLLEQLLLAQEAVKALKIKMLANDDYEADDLIGSLAKTLEKTSLVSIVTGDRDLLQLISENTTVELCQKGVSNTKKVTQQSFFEEYRFEPAGIIELKALMGDSSDNIPGVKGVGEKTGMSLIQEFRTIDNLYSHIDSVAKPKVREKLLSDKEMAYLSHDLATIRRDVSTINDCSEIAWNSDNMRSDEFAEFLIRYQFTSLHKEFIGTPIAASVEGGISLPELKPLSGERLIAKSIADIEGFFKELGDKPLCFDVETNSLNPITGSIIGVSLAGDYNKAIYAPLRHVGLALTPYSQLDPAEFFACFKKNIKNRLLIGHNLKFDLAFLRNENICINGLLSPKAESAEPLAQPTLFDLANRSVNNCECQPEDTLTNPLFDTMIASYLVNPTRSNALKALGKTLLGFETEEYKQVSKPNGFAEVDAETASRYACQDVLLTMRLYERVKNELKEGSLQELFDKIEMPIMSVLLDMECAGIGLNSDYLRNLREELTDKLKILEESIYDYAKHEFNINSTQQLQKVLFSELGLTPPKKTKTGFSTDSDVLKALVFAHPICKELIEYRELEKLRSTYTEALIEQINPKTGLIHTSFNQTVTATGRLSSSNPNLQNIPVKTDLGKKIRKAFVPPRKGDSLISIDYSQIELRLLAHFSRDKNLVEAFNNNVDIHAITAAKIFNKAPQEVSSKERSIGKTVNFGIVYGISAHGLAQNLEVSRVQAKEYIDSFNKSFSQVEEFFNEVVEETKKSKVVKTMLGRVRSLEDINSSKFHARSAAERMAKNTRLQGSAADLVKKAMIDSVKILKSKGLKTKLILQIHDELVFSAPQNEIKEAASLLKHTMETCVELFVPLVCDVAIGPNLADLEEIKF